MRNLLVCVAAVLGFASAAAGQTTRPVDGAADAPVVAPAATEAAASPAVAEQQQHQAWPAAVEAFTKAMVEGDLSATEAMLGARASVRRFDAAQDGEVSRMVGRVARSTVVGRHAYLHPPLVMAADVAADFKNAAGVPDKAKARYMIDDESEIKRGNATAVQWVVEQLDARGGTPIGVIVLWTPRPATAGAGAGDAANHDVVFVLCRGEEVSPREFKIHAVVYGNPVPEAGK